jgi:hypothetical protein
MTVVAFPVATAVQGANAAPNAPIPGKAPRSGLIYLRNEVERQFGENDVGAIVTPVGLRYRTEQNNQASPGRGGRVCFIPGKFDGSLALKPREYGSISRFQQGSASAFNPRELVEWEREATVSVWGRPPLDSQSDEEAAHEAAEDLLELTIRAMSNARLINPTDGTYSSFGIGAAITWGGVTLISPPGEIFAGIELLVGFTLKGPFFDATLDLAFPTLVMSKSNVTAE